MGPTSLDAPLNRYAIKAAQLNYLLSLIAAGDTDAATKVAVRLAEKSEVSENRRALEKLVWAGYAEPVWKFLDQLLVTKPALGLWGLYVQLSAMTGNSEPLIARLEVAYQAASAAGDQTRLRSQLISALLAAAKIQEAVALINSSLDDAATTAENRTKHGRTLAELGLLTSRPEWLDKGLKTLRLGLESTRGTSVRTHEAEPVQRIWDC